MAKSGWCWGDVRTDKDRIRRLLEGWWWSWKEQFLGDGVDARALRGEEVGRRPPLQQEWLQQGAVKHCRGERESRVSARRERLPGSACSRKRLSGVAVWAPTCFEDLMKSMRDSHLCKLAHAQVFHLAVQSSETPAEADWVGRRWCWGLLSQRLWAFPRSHPLLFCLIQGPSPSPFHKDCSHFTGGEIKAQAGVMGCCA